MLRRPVFFLAATLFPAIALASPPIPKEALGTWAPGADYRGEASVEVDGDGLLRDPLIFSCGFWRNAPHVFRSVARQSE